MIHQYKTKKELENAVKAKLQELGVTESLKGVSQAHYDFFYNLCKRHPRQLDKLKNIEDIEIRQDAMNKKGLAINIINKDGSKTEISWRKCVSGISESQSQLFKSALRQSISSQILEFREKADVSICSLCKTSLKDKTLHIDHEIHFIKLVEDFLELNKINIPDEYDKKQITFETMFKNSDKHIGDLFYDYHLKHAKLRVVCEKCNLTREKWVKPT
jgi:hypothetical protein